MEIAQNVQASWIYNFSDYQQMYDMSPNDLSKSILDFSAGIASFNAEATRQGARVTSADFSYALPESDMRNHAQQFLQRSITDLKKSPRRLRNASVVEMQRVTDLWEKTKKTFLQDYPSGLTTHRYQATQLPQLPYKTHQFDLALCTDFIFHHALSITDTATIVSELCRVAAEVRIFPLLDDQGHMSEALGPLMLMLQKKNYGVEVRQVPYQTLRGGNAMLRIWEQACVVA